MKVIRGIGRVRQSYKNPVVAIGVFDGLHNGHQQIIRNTIRRARRINGTAMVMTFFPHPVHVLRPEVRLPLIVSLAYRLKLIEQLGIDVCVVIPFTKRFSQLTPEKFIKRYLINRIKPREVIIGDDFRFGHDRTGTLDYFKDAGRQCGFDVFTLHVMHGGRKTVSSSRIRRFIADGKLGQAARLLARPVSVMGRVVRGDARGRTLGYPTANIDTTHDVLLPAGVFLVNVKVKDKSYPGIANIGRRPSFNKPGQVKLEVHILDFHKNLYGKEIIVEFVKKIRDEKQFPSKTALIQQVQKDEQKARRWLSAAH